MLAMHTFETLAELPPRVGQEVAVSDWITVTQDQVQLFADATGDQQWIHVDVERARAGPFGAPIAHGFLTLALLPRFFQMCIRAPQVRMSVNYGLNKVRFPAPVPVGSRVRGRIKLVACDPLEGGGVQITWGVTVEREGSDKPVCVAETLTRWYA
jgi:acyl dehydratase